jgi:hypothetical protein
MPSQNKGYYQTPNVNVPLNARDKGEIAKVAWQQLKPYQDAARTWPIYKLMRDSRHCNLCRVCDQNIYFDSDTEENEYHYTDEDIVSLIIAHIRQTHEGMVTNVSQGQSEVLDSASNNDTGDISNSYASGYVD